jgi:hypothetical protein
VVWSCQVRKEKRVLKEDVTIQKSLDLERKKEQRALIKASLEEARRIRELGKAKLLEQARINYESRIHREEEEALRRERDVAQMERVEIELIQQLKSTQMLQRAALEELDCALRIDA